jgi:hypothetical protein
MHGQRGQTLPVWTFGIITTLMLALMVFNYASSVRWQIRAQNAADAVAQGIMSVQSQHYNQILMNLHASAIEEWRIRRTLNALLEVMQGNGGCETPGTLTGSPTASGTGDGRDCATVYANLRANYVADVARYTQDVQTMSALTNYTQTQQIADMNTIAASFENTCTSSGAAGGDCAFKYTITSPVDRPNLSGVANDAGGTRVGAGEALPAGTQSDLQPLEIEVIACAVVSSPFQSFFKMNVQPFTAIGRAAATTAMITQEWSAPGVQTNPNSPSDTAFQPPEFPESSVNTAPGSSLAYASGNFCRNPQGLSGYDWYAVHWCANAWTASYGTNPVTGAPNYGGFGARITTDEYSVWTGWWGALPIPAFNTTTPFTPTTTNCAQSTAWNT